MVNKQTNLYGRAEYSTVIPYKWRLKHIQDTVGNVRDVKISEEEKCVSVCVDSEGGELCFTVSQYLMASIHLRNIW